MFVSTLKAVVHKQIISSYPHDNLSPSRKTGTWCRRANIQQCKAQLRLEELIEEIDIVEYSSPSSGQGGPRHLGRVLQVDASSNQLLLEALTEEENGVYVADDQTGRVTVKATSVLRTIDYELSQRQDKVSNPHGEHAHDVFIIQLPPTIQS